MSNVEFNENNEFQFKSREIIGAPRRPGMVKWLEEKGIVKDEKMAQYVLFGVIVICFGLAGIIFADGFGSDERQPELTESQIRSLPENDFRRIHFENNN